MQLTKIMAALASLFAATQARGREVSWEGYTGANDLINVYFKRQTTLSDEEKVALIKAELTED